MTGFRSELAALDIENVYVYVADAVRWDHLPSRVGDRGAVLKSVAASIHSPPAFASMLTGRYMPAHGVTAFDRQLSASLFTPFDLDAYDRWFVNAIGTAGTEDPIYDVLNIDREQRAATLPELDEPFVVIERGQGGHAPYGNFEGSAVEYFDARREASVEEIRAEYGTGVETDAETFIERVETLERDGHLEETLVVYTADHGELLGEGGQFGHNGPIRPELAYVPTVFVHPDLTSQTPELQCNQVDLLPTLLDVLGEPALAGLDGTSIFDSGSSPGLSFYKNRHDIPRLPVSASSVYESVWDSDGGHVFARSPAYERVVGLASDLLASPQRHLARRRVPELVSSYLSSRATFGNPSMTPAEAATCIDQVHADSSGESNDSSAIDVSAEAQQHLRDLGYLE